MDRQASSSPPRHLEPPPMISPNLQHQSQAMEQASSSGLHFYQSAPMDPCEPDQNPDLPSTPHESPQVAQSSQVGYLLSSPPSESIDIVPPADSTFLETRRLPPPQISVQLASQINAQATFQVAPHSAFLTATHPGAFIDFPTSQDIAQTNNLSNSVLSSSHQPQASSSQATICSATSEGHLPDRAEATKTSSDGLKRHASPLEKPAKLVKFDPSSTGQSAPTNQASPIKKGKGKDENTSKPLIPVNFIDVVAHTAKCDVCDKRNQNGMARCSGCGWQICNSCVSERGGDRAHENVRGRHMPAEDIERLVAQAATNTSNVGSSSPPPRVEQLHPLLAPRSSDNTTTSTSSGRLPPVGEFTNPHFSTPARRIATPRAKGTLAPKAKPSSASKSKGAGGKRLPRKGSNSDCASSFVQPGLVSAPSDPPFAPSDSSGPPGPPDDSTSPSNNSPTPCDDPIPPPTASSVAQTDGTDTLRTDGWRIYGTLDVMDTSPDMYLPKLPDSPTPQTVDTSYNDILKESSEELPSPPDYDKDYVDILKESSEELSSPPDYDKDEVDDDDIRAAQALVELSSRPKRGARKSDVDNSLAQNVLPEDWATLGEEFCNPRRNPSRRARPINMKV